jgi:hypothetical protein
MPETVGWTQEGGHLRRDPVPEQTQKQSVERCAELRQNCRDAIFEKMDEQHGETLEALTDIRVKLAERVGRDSAADVPAARRWSWKEVAAVIAVTVAAIGAAIGAIWKGISP